MALIVTPGQLTCRAELYHQLAQLTTAGLGLVPALEQLHRHPPARSFRTPLQTILGSISQGFTFAESAGRARSWLPGFDLALLDAGERSGRLDVCFRLLAAYYSDRARMLRQMIGDLAYPVALFHFAIFVIPFAQFFASGNLAVYLGQTFGVLLPIYALVALIIYTMQSKHGEVWRGGVERLLHPVPILGGARRDLALARLSVALEALLSAGVNIIEAWELAAAVSGSPVLRHAVRSWRGNVQAGQTPAEAVSASGCFPDMFANQYATGEMSGKLDEVLRRLHAYYQEEGSRKLHALAQWTPRMVYLLVALMIAYKVVSFYSGYFQQIQNIGGF